MRESTGSAGGASAIVDHIPYIRRYARALTGSQRRGDSYVRLCLETILAEPERMAGDAKLQLFTAFHDAWRAINVEQSDDEPGVERIEHGLAMLPAIERQVLLLTSLEEFSVTQTASILGLSVEDTRELLEQARRDLRIESSLPILIIEDEPVIAMELARIVREMGHRVCGTAARQRDAIDLAKRTRPALILADIQLKGEDDGISTVGEILHSIHVPIIFVTGFPERLLTGDKLEPAFVIAKPFNPEALKTAIGQALTVVPPADSPEARIS
jgi:CheY-like chemotaxis protein